MYLTTQRSTHAISPIVSSPSFGRGTHFAQQQSSTLQRGGARGARRRGGSDARAAAAQSAGWRVLARAEKNSSDARTASFKK
jgi:hypothetical protein